MIYLEAFTLVDGALDEEQIFTDWTMFDDWLDVLEDEANADGYHIDVFIIPHEHDYEPGLNCQCAQFLTDHKPFRTFGPTI